MEEFHHRRTCPRCRRTLELRRTDSLTTAEYEASCPCCGLRELMKEYRCGGCHTYRLFRWIKGFLTCLTCGHVRNHQPIPRGRRGYR